MKFDYRVNWTHKESELLECIGRWLHTSDAEVVERYFNTAHLFQDYYLSDGTEKLTERQVKKHGRSKFASVVEHAERNRDDAMQRFFDAVPGWVDDPVRGKLQKPEELQALLGPYFHKVNWMRIHKALALQAPVNPIDESEDEEEEEDLDDESE